MQRFKDFPQRMAEDVGEKLDGAQVEQGRSSRFMRNFGIITRVMFH